MDYKDKYNKLSKGKVEEILNRPITDAEYREIMKVVLLQLLNENEEKR